MWLVLGFAVDGFVESGSKDSFLQYWSGGAPPWGLNKFVWVTGIEALLLAIVGISTASFFSEGDEATVANLSVIEELLLGEIAAGNRQNVTAVPMVEQGAPSDLQRVERVLGAWIEIEPSVAQVVESMRTVPAEMQKQVEALADSVGRIAGPVRDVMAATVQAQEAMSTIAKSTESAALSLSAVTEGRLKIDGRFTS